MVVSWGKALVRVHVIRLSPIHHRKEGLQLGLKCFGLKCMAFLKRSSKGFDSDLRSLAGLVAEMGGCAERQLAEAIVDGIQAYQKLTGPVRRTATR